MTAEFFGERSPFHPASAVEPSAIFARPLRSEEDKAALDTFLKGRPFRPVDGAQLYNPLQENEIRVLELFPSALDDHSEGRLHIVSTDFEYPKIWPVHSRRVPGASRTLFAQRQLNHAISLIDKKPVWYTALSYTWVHPFSMRLSELAGVR